MIRNVDVPLKDLAGAPLYAALDLQQLLAATAKLTDEQRAALAAAINATGRAEMTLKATIVNALQAMFEDERALDGEEKLKRWQLAMRVYLGGDVDLSSSASCTGLPWSGRCGRRSRARSPKQLANQRTANRYVRRTDRHSPRADHG